MYAHVKEKWIAALRSGKYKQTTGRLMRGDGYCCLGVLCQIAVDEKAVDVHEAFGPDLRWSVGYPLPKVIAWAGQDPNITTYAGWSLSDWNDKRGATFEQIADMIEQHMPITPDPEQKEQNNG